MPRRPRLALPGVPLHLIQRGNNRQACFFAEEDYRFYLEWLAEYAGKIGCRLHTYVLMTNHVHLLISADSAEAPGALMKALGQRYVQYVNRIYRRSGTLWEGRFRSCPIQEEAYLLACQRYIELNPVRAGMVEHLWRILLVELPRQRGGCRECTDPTARAVRGVGAGCDESAGCLPGTVQVRIGARAGRSDSTGNQWQFCAG
ncbi:transposase [Pseudogulbenkiania sp. MAI-1]|uniref:transposase n=1 Tax=Pseudogulbenkiania sp. MAI-1 TaxID=990370 RepID=UPI0018DC2116|nr:transposase [Pseudogulbenkiania sp. MAI-1]